MKHLEKFPATRAENAARRARRYGVHGFQGIKEILQKGLDFEAMQAELPLPAATPTYRFTRPVGEMLGRHIEGEA